MHTHTHAHMHTRTCTHMHAHSHTCTHMHTHTHTHTHESTSMVHVLVSLYAARLFKLYKRKPSSSSFMNIKKLLNMITYFRT